MTRSTRRARLLTALLLVAFIPAATGCYSRVVGVKGGVYNGEVYEPNLKEDEHIPIIDDVVNVFDDSNKKK
jgi:hypothetical protein